MPALVASALRSMRTVRNPNSFRQPAKRSASATAHPNFARPGCAYSSTPTTSASASAIGAPSPQTLDTVAAATGGALAGGRRPRRATTCVAALANVVSANVKDNAVDASSWEPMDSFDTFRSSSPPTPPCPCPAAVPPKLATSRMVLLRFSRARRPAASETPPPPPAALGNSSPSGTTCERSHAHEVWPVFPHWSTSRNATRSA
mmetsp:Transcript_9983/g.31445  ORF Transcript_9983/g.31445 Transcript_9983/m.31445 type:complete len:204 (-) Transcript_9983:2268-2879(-)